MYRSIKNKNIVLAFCAMWDGEVDIYAPNVKAIELGVSIINGSKSHLLIDQLVLRVQKTSFIFNSYDDLPVEIPRQFINTHSRLDFVFDLKPILDSFGDEKKIHFIVVSGKTKIESKRISIKEIHNDVRLIYARHF